MNGVMTRERSPRQGKRTQEKSKDLSVLPSAPGEDNQIHHKISVAAAFLFGKVPYCYGV